MAQPTREYSYQIFHLLQQHYPNAKMILNWGNNVELLAAIILSAQCTDLMVNKVTARLFPKYRQEREDLKSRREYEADMQKIRISSENRYLHRKEFNRARTLQGPTPQYITKDEAIELLSFAYVPVEELEQDIKSTGFYHNKAKNIQAAAKMIIENYQGALPGTITELITIPGVGRKTANVFLGNAYHVYEGIAVDTHVMKQAQILGLTTNTTPERIEKDLMKLFKQKDWFILTYLLIEHGRNMRRKKSNRIICHVKSCILLKHHKTKKRAFSMA